MRRVFVDTNVLFPFSVMDLMLALTEDGVHDVLWSDALLDEWERVIVREQHRTAELAAKITSVIREFFADSKVETAAFVHLVDQMPSNDPDDRQHIAAAVAGGAEVIVTWNQCDFRAESIGSLGLRVIDPDSYLQELLAASPDEVVTTVVRLADQKHRPPMTATELAAMLAKAGVPTFAAILRQHLSTDRPSS
jgi:predicted nucleic acid-binding protein